LEVVEHGQELRDDPLARAGQDLRLLAGDPLAVVVEVGRDAPQVVHRLLVVALRVLQAREEVLGIEPVDRWLRAALGITRTTGLLFARRRRAKLAAAVVLLRHDAFTSSSSITSYSASSTTSSVVPPPSPEGGGVDADCCASAYTACASGWAACSSAVAFALRSARSFASSAWRTSMMRPSIVPASDASSLSRCSARAFSV